MARAAVLQFAVRKGPRLSCAVLEDAAVAAHPSLEGAAAAARPRLVIMVGLDCGWRVRSREPGLWVVSDQGGLWLGRILQWR